MKSRELIKRIQEADPSLDGEVCVDNHDIYFVEPKPAYWDGMLQRIIVDENIKGYNVVGAKYTGNGEKINLRTLSIEDAISSNPDLPVSYEGGNPDKRTTLHNEVEQWRMEVRRINKQIEDRHNEPSKPKPKFYSFATHIPKMYAQFPDNIGCLPLDRLTDFMTRLSISENGNYWYPANYSKDDDIIQKLLAADCIKFTDDKEDHVGRSLNWSNLVDGLFENGL